jgi:glycosyltransferase involved in cell wall biosynthesis
VRLLALGSLYPPQHLGGYELAWQAAMHAARSQGHAVRILTTESRIRPGAPEDDLDVRRDLRWYWDPGEHALPALSPWQRLSLERHNRHELARELTVFAPDVVCWWGMAGMSLALIEQVRRAGLPAVFLVHDDWLIDAWDADGWMRAWRRRSPRARRLAQRLTGIATVVDVAAAGPVVFNSARTRERARRAGQALATAPVIHPGIDARFLNAAAPRDWAWRVAYVGRIDAAKGIDTAVAALGHLPVEATLTIWGEGDRAYMHELTMQAAGLGAADRVRFAGFAGGEQLRVAYAEADAVVFPARWEEPFGLVPLEAMGVGRPVVATARGGSAEYLRDGDNALVFPADDADALAAALARLAADGALRERLRVHGHETAARYTAGRFARETVAAIEAAAGGA